MIQNLDTIPWLGFATAAGADFLHPELLSDGALKLLNFGWQALLFTDSL